MIALSSLAQDGIKKGSIYGGVGLGVYSQKQESESSVANTVTKDDPVKNFNWEIMPEVNYFILNNVSVGLAIGMNGSKSKSSYTQGNTKNERTYKSGGPSFELNGRKFFNCSPNFNTFIGLGFDFSSGKGEEENKATTNNVSISTKVKNESKNMNIGLNAGFSYNVSPRVMLLGTFALLSYYSNTYKSNIKTSPDSYNLSKYSGIQLDISNRNIPFNLGFLYLLNP